MLLTEKQKSEGWRIVKFGDVAQEVKSSTKDPLGEGIERYIGLEHIDPESLRLVRWGWIAEDNPTFTKKFRAGDILFGRRRAYLKKAAVADFDGICSGDITVITPKGDALVPGLLPFIVQSEPFFGWAMKHSAGGLSPRTKFKSLAEFEFPLPPRPRQKEMLKILKKIEDVILKNEATRYSVHQFSVLLLKQYRTSERVKSWKLDQLGSWKGGGTPSKRNKAFWENGSILWASPKDMSVDFLDDTEDKITEEAIKKSSTQLIPGDSILFVTRSGILRHTLPIVLTKKICTINQDIKALTPSDAFCQKFVWLVLKLYAEDIRHSCSKVGTTVESININWLREYKIPLPSKKKQIKYVDLWEKHSQAIESINNNLIELATIRKSISNKLLRKELHERF